MEVNMEATEVNIYTFIYKVMCYESQRICAHTQWMNEWMNDAFI